MLRVYKSNQLNLRRANITVDMQYPSALDPVTRDMASEMHSERQKLGFSVINQAFRIDKPGLSNSTSVVNQKTRFI